MEQGVATAWVALMTAVCVVCASNEAYTAIFLLNYYNMNRDDNLKVGRSINLLPHFGFMTLSIKVFPQEDKWLFREETAEVFQKNSYRAVESHSTSSQSQHTAYDPHFVVNFCDNAKDLLTAYFDNFYIEGVPEPYSVFTSSMSSKAMAQNLGIHSTFLSSGHSFVLVRLIRRKKRATLDGKVALTNRFKSATSQIRIGSTESVNQFLDQYGTHVITGYEIGDVLYQVYVFGERTYWDFKNNFAMSKSDDELIRMERYFTPSYAVHIGSVKLASGDPLFENTMMESLMHVEFFQVYPSIFYVFKTPGLEETLEKLDGEAVIGMNLEKITKIVPKTPERHWLGEILDNTLSLFYITM